MTGAIGPASTSTISQDARRPFQSVRPIMGSPQAGRGL